MWEIDLDSIPSGGKEEKERNLRWTFTVRYRVWWWWEKENRSWFVRDSARYYVRYGKEREEVEPRENIGGIVVVVVFFRQLFLVSSAIGCGIFSLKTYFPKNKDWQGFFYRRKIHNYLRRPSQLTTTQLPPLEKGDSRMEANRINLSALDRLMCKYLPRALPNPACMCQKKGDPMHTLTPQSPERKCQWIPDASRPSTRHRFIPLKCKLKCHS